MPYLTNNSSHCQGLYNYIAELEIRLYGKLIEKEDLLQEHWTLYVVSSKTGIKWVTRKMAYCNTPNTIYTTKEIAELACHNLNNIKENHAS